MKAMPILGIDIAKFKFDVCLRLPDDQRHAAVFDKRGAIFTMSLRDKSAIGSIWRRLVEILSSTYFPPMSTVAEIESAISRLSRNQMREWLENVLEDQLEMTDEFKAQIERSEREMAEGKQPRVRKP